MVYQKKSEGGERVSLVNAAEIEDAIRSLHQRVQQLAEITAAQTEEMTKMKFALGELNNRVTPGANASNYAGPSATKTYQ